MRGGAGPTTHAPLASAAAEGSYKPFPSLSSPPPNRVFPHLRRGQSRPACGHCVKLQQSRPPLHPAPAAHPARPPTHPLPSTTPMRTQARCSSTPPRAWGWACSPAAPARSRSASTAPTTLAPWQRWVGLPAPGLGPGPCYEGVFQLWRAASDLLERDHRLCSLCCLLQQSPAAPPAACSHPHALPLPPARRGPGRVPLRPPAASTLMREATPRLAHPSTPARRPGRRVSGGTWAAAG